MKGPAHLSKEQVLDLLRELGAALLAKGLHGDLYLVGGAAVALSVDTRRTTRDVDAVFQPGDAVRDAAAEIAARHGLPPGWLSRAAAAFSPNDDDADAVRLEVPGLSVAVASPRHLLAMTMAAGRERDLGDLVALFEILGIRTPEEAVAIARHLYGPESVVLSDPDESYLWLAEDVLAEIRRRRGGQ